jgi:hypothetical protein
LRIKSRMGSLRVDYSRYASYAFSHFSLKTGCRPI